MVKVLLYLRLIDLDRKKVPGTRLFDRQVFLPHSLNSLKNTPISETRFGVPTGNLILKGVAVRLENQKREPNA